MTEEEKKKLLEAAAAKNRENAAVIEAVAMTEPGKKLFRMLHDLCGFAEENMVFNQKTLEIDTVGTTYNEVRRAIYLRFRRHIPVEIRRDIENPIATEEKK